MPWWTPTAAGCSPSDSRRTATETRLLVRHAAQPAVERVGPAVVGAADGGPHVAAFFDDLAAAVAAEVVEGPQPALRVAHHEQRVARHPAGDEVSRFLEVRGKARPDPGAVEQRGPFPVVPRGVEIGLARQELPRWLEFSVHAGLPVRAAACGRPVRRRPRRRSLTLDVIIYARYYTSQNRIFSQKIAQYYINQDTFFRSYTDMITDPIHPGEHLAEILDELGISQYRLAKAIGVPPRRINEIVPRPPFHHPGQRGADWAGSRHDAGVLDQSARSVRSRSRSRFDRRGRHRAACCGVTGALGRGSRRLGTARGRGPGAGLDGGPARSEDRGSDPGR